MSELVLTNAKIVLADEVIEGSLRVADGRIEAVDAGALALPAAIDCEGDYLLPGLIDLHTDNVEKHIIPRPGVRWLPLSAILAHDAQVISAGITTVFNALAVGSSMRMPERAEILTPMVDAMRTAEARGMLRASHRLHMRCEITDERVVELFAPFIGDRLVGLMSVMDHAPGHRQSPDVARYRDKQIRKLHLTEQEADEQIAALMQASQTIGPTNRKVLAALARARGIPMASHDDATAAHIEEAHRLGFGICEFPTTCSAAAAARQRGLSIVMGAPNVMRGGSQADNVAAIDLANRGHLDILASDYVPISLLQGAFKLTSIGIELPTAIRSVSLDPAAAVGLDDRGVIEPQKRADLVRASLVDGLPVVQTVWSAGRQVY